MNSGYARVSTQDQTLAFSQNALAKDSCDRIFTDTASGAKADRPGLNEALSHLRKDDTLVVWKLDRLGRILKQRIEVTIGLDRWSIGLQSLQEQIDTTTPGGQLVFHVFDALAAFECALLRERQREGIVLAKRRGAYKGPKPRSHETWVSPVKPSTSTCAIRYDHMTRYSLYKTAGRPEGSTIFILFINRRTPLCAFQ